VMRGGVMLEDEIVYAYGVTKNNTSRLRSKLLDPTGYTRLADLGDSLTAGSVSVAFPLGERATARSHYTALSLSTLLGLTVEERTLCGLSGKTSQAAYETMVPEYNFVSGTIGANNTMGGRQFQHAVASGADVYTPGGTFQFVDLFLAGPTSGRSIVWAASTGATGTIAGDSNFNPKLVTLDMVGDATWVSFRAGTAAAVNWHIIECYNADAKRVALWNSGWNGADSIDWSAVTPASGPVGMLSFTNPDGVILGVGPNDCNDGTPIATFKANLQVPINAVKALGGTIALLGQPPMDPSFYGGQSNINLYETAIAQTAANNNIPYIEYRSLLGADWAESVANGYSYGGADPVHLTPLGCEFVAENAIIPYYETVLAAVA
jgi:hypothetical protein